MYFDYSKMRTVWATNVVSAFWLPYFFSLRSPLTRPTFKQVFTLVCGNSSHLCRPLKQCFCSVYWPNFWGRAYTWRCFHYCLILSILCSCFSFYLSTRWRVESRWGRDFPPVQTGPEAHPASCKMGTGSFPGTKCGRGVLLTTHPLLVPRSWKSRAILLPTLWATPGLGHTGPVTGSLYLYAMKSDYPNRLSTLG